MYCLHGKFIAGDSFIEEISNKKRFPYENTEVIISCAILHRRQWGEYGKLKCSETFVHLLNSQNLPLLAVFPSLFYPLALLHWFDGAGKNAPIQSKLWKSSCFICDAEYFPSGAFFNKAQLSVILALQERFGSPLFCLFLWIF